MIQSFENTNKQISISKFAKKYEISTNKLIKHLINGDKLIQEAEFKLISNGSFIHNVLESNKKVIKVNENSLIKYLREDLATLALDDDEKYTIGAIKNPGILSIKLKETKNKTLMFLDLEYKQGNYYEVAYSIYKNNELIEEEYIFVEEIHSKNKQEFLKSKKIPFKTQKREEINLRLSKVIKKVDYIVAHNSYCERSALMSNGIILKKHKFLCTANISKKLNNLTQDMSLSTALGQYKIKFDHLLHHFAFYDTKMTKMLYDRLVEN